MLEGRITDVRRTALFLALIFAFAACSDRLPTSPFINGNTLSGTVTDERGSPVAVATVVVVSRESQVLNQSKSDDRGRYRLTRLRTGRHFLYVYLGQMELLRTEIELREGDNTYDIVV